MYYFFLFWCVFCILIVLCYVLVDIIFIFSYKVTGKVISADIFSRNLTTHGIDEWYDVNIHYSYQYNGVSYSNGVLNSWNNVYTKSRPSLERLLAESINENQVDVYVFPWKPQYACVFPLRWNKIVPISILVIFSLTLIATIFVNHTIQ